MTRRLPPCRSPRFDGLMEELEPRILFNADVVAAVAPTMLTDVTAPPTVQTQVLPPVPSTTVSTTTETDSTANLAQAQQTEIVFVDASVPDAQKLLDDLLAQQSATRQIEVKWLDAQSDGIEQISAELAGRHDIVALHIISHGSDGQVQLGSTCLNDDTLHTYVQQLSGWGNALSEDADILIYGCDVAQTSQGQHFVDDLALLTGADVAASNNKTGAIDLGGDWKLEYNYGHIETTNLAPTGYALQWEHVLATLTLQDGLNGYTDTTDTYLHTSTGIADNTNYSASTTLLAGEDGTGGQAQLLVRFDNLVGTGTNQIPAGSTITAATLTMQITTASTFTNPGFDFHRMLVSWADTSTWDAMGSGVSTPGEASSTTDGTITENGTGSYTIASNANMIATVQAWINNPSSNYGWWTDNGSYSARVAFASAENATTSYRPKLTITYTPPSPPSMDLDANNSSGGTGNNYSGAFTESALSNASNPAAIIDVADATITAGATGNMTGLTAVLASTPDGVKESLSANTSGTSITWSYSSGTKTLTLSGTDTAAHYQQVLRSLTYDNTSDTPTTTARSIALTLTDANNQTSTATATISVTAANDAPIITSNGGGASASVSVSETLTAVTSVVASDPEGTALTYSLSGVDAARFSISGSGVLTFSAAPDFESPADTGGNNVYDVTVQVSDGSRTTTQVFAVTVTDVSSTLVVTTTADTNDSGLGSSFTAEQLNAVNGGTDGKVSLREAIIAANNTAGTDNVTFNIATGTAGTGNDAGAYVITLSSALPTITQAITLNASTQSGYVAGGLHTVVIDGNDASAYGLDLTNTADGSTIRGLLIRNTTAYGIYIESGSDSNTIVGNFIGSFYADGSNAGAGKGNATAGIFSYGGSTTIGGTTAADRNVISGNTGGYNIYLVTGADNTVIKGNYIGLNAAGTAIFSTTNPQYGVMIETSATNVTIGGTATGAGNVISGHTREGIWVTTTGTATIQGNYIGTDVTGTVDLGNTRWGIYVDDAGSATIGGTATGAGNLISGNDLGGIYASNSGSVTVQGNIIGLNASGTAKLANTGPGIYLNTGAASTIGGNNSSARNIISGNATYGIDVESSPTGGHVIKGNYIGVGSDGVTLLGNTSAGIYINANNAQVGGKTSGDGNVIAGNGGAGIAVAGGTGNLFYRNVIYSNTGLGIDLGNDGVTANDYNDGDGGVNYLTNYPVITSAVVNGTTTTITGSIDFYNHATADTIYIELFSSPSVDPSGYGEGKTYLGAASVTTDPTTGDATFSITVTGVTVGDYITAVANVETSYLGASEFAKAVQAVAPANAPRGKAIWNVNDRFNQNFADWSGTGFSGVGTDGLNLTDDISMILAASSPTRNETIFIGAAEGSGVSLAGIWNGTTWSSVISVPLGTPSATADHYDSFAVAYDQASGDAMLIWDNGNTGTTGLSYATWNGTTWSTPATITGPISGEPVHMKLAANPNGHEMTLAVETTAASNNQYAIVWNGSSWGNAQTLGSNSNNQYFELNVAYEQRTGHAMVLYDNSASDSASVQYRVWSGSAWGSEGTVTAPAGITAASDLYSTSIAADPTSNRIALVAKNAAHELWAAVWDGSSWGNTLAVTTSGVNLTDNHATMAVAFESQSGDLLLAYGKASGPNVYYRTWTSGGGWSAETTGPSMGAADIPYLVKLYNDPYSNTIMMGVQDDHSVLTFVAWDGSAWGTPTVLEANTLHTYREQFTYVWYQTSPVFNNLAGDTLAYVEKQVATVIDQGTSATLTMSDETAYNGGNLTVSFTSGSTNGEDVLAIRNQGAGASQIGLSGANVTYGGTVIGSYTGGSNGNNLVITFGANATNAAVSALVRNITYQNTNTTTPSTTTRTVRFVATNAYGRASSNNDVSVTVAAVNDAPTLTATASNPTFTEAAGSAQQAAAVGVFSGTAINAIESGQSIYGLTFTVSGLVDGTNEHVVVDGTTLALGANSSSITGTNGMSYSVTVSAGTATISLTKVVGITAANAQALVNSISYQNVSTDNPTSGNRVITLTQIQDTGGTSNGGQDTSTLSVGSTVTVNAVNDAPTLSSTALNPTFTEGSGAGVQGTAVNVFTGTSIGTIESGQNVSGLTFTVSGLLDGANESIVVDGTTITLGGNSASSTATNGMSYSVSIVSGTATVTLTKVAGISTGAAQTLVNGITYQNTNLDNPTTGNRVFTLTQIKDTGGTSNGGTDTTTLSIASTVTVTPVNDAPTLTATSLNPSFTEAAGSATQAAAVSVFSGAAVSTVESSQTITGLTFTVSGLLDGSSEVIVVDGTSITLGGAGSGTTGTNAMSYSVAVSSGTATITLTKAGGISTSSAQTLVNGITYQNTSTDNPTSGARVFTLTQIKDNGGTANGGVDTTTLSVASTVTVNPVNDAPTLTATSSNPTFTEAAGSNTQAAAVKLFTGAAASTVESGQLITGLSFTITGIVNGASEKIVVDGTAITLGASSGPTNTATNSMSCTVTVSGGNATVVLSKPAGITTAQVQTLVNNISYQNTNKDNPTAGNRVFTLTQIVDNGGTTNGGSDTGTVSIISTVNVKAVNDAPTLTTTAANPTFTEAAGSGTQAAAVNMFTGTTISTVEAGQTITGLTFTVSGLLDGANESIFVSGTTLTLGGASSGTTASNSMSYTVSVSSGTATVTLTNASGITAAAAQTLVNGITYQNTNTDAPTAGNRVFTLTQIKDNGGTANAGADTTVLSNASTVTVNASNDAPTLTATSVNPTFTEAAGVGTQAAAVGVFSGSAISTIESGQNIAGLTFTVSGLLDGANERLVVDGKAITLGGNSTGTTTTNSLNYTVTLSGGTATIALTGSISSATAQTLVDGITYQNTNTDNPTAGNRVFTLTQIKDSGGTANGGSDTTTLSVASTVTVTPTNDAPVAQNDTAFTDAITAIDVNVKANDTDVDNTLNSLVVHLVSPDANVSVNPDGTIHFDPQVAGSQTVTYYVTDAGGLSSANATLTVTLTANTPPTSANVTRTTLEDTSYVLQTSDFTFADADGGQTFGSILLASLPATGSLTLNGSAVSANDVITSSAIALGQLVFTPASNANGLANSSFSFKVQDNLGGTAVLANVFTFDVTPVDDAPTLITTALNPSFNEASGLGVQAAAVNVFSGTSIDPIEAAQTIMGLTFTISGLTDGSNEVIMLDGLSVALGSNSSGTTTTNGMNYSVNISGATATVSLTHATGIASAAAASLVDNITYQNTSIDTPSSGNRVFTLTQIQDSGSAANGGLTTTALSSASTVSVQALNDAPTATVTALDPTFTEANGQGTQAPAVNMFSGASVSTIESGQSIINLSFTVSGLVDGADEVIQMDGTTISLGANSSGTSSGNTLDYNVTVSGGTATITLNSATGITVASVQTLINGITYQNTNLDAPTAGDRIVTLTQIQDDGGTVNGGADTGTFNLASTVTVTPINDAPTLSNNIGMSLNEGATASIDNTMLSVSDVDNSTAELTYTISVTPTHGQIELSSNPGVAITSFTQADINNGLLRYSHDGSESVSDSMTFTVSDGAGGSIGSTAFNITVTPVNDAPTLTTTALDPVFMEAAGSGTQAAGVAIFSGTSIDPVEVGQSITNLTFTVSGLLDGGNESITVDGDTITLGSSHGGTTTAHGLTYSVALVSDTATVVLSKAGGISAATAQSVIDGMRYQNTETDNPTAGDRVVTLTQIMDNGGTSNGGVDTTPLAWASTITVTPVNDAPTLGNTALNPTFTEAAGLGTQSGVVQVFNGTSIGNVETGQAITDVTFTISGLRDGNSEVIVIDGSTLTLGSNHSGTTSGSALNYSVTISGSTATVTVNSAGGMSAAATQGWIDAITYQNTNTDDLTAGNRVFTITHIQDNGGTLNGGANASTIAVASTVNVVTVNDAPALSSTALNPTFTEAAGAGTQASAVTVFSGTTVSAIEASQTIKSLTFTVSGIVDGASERIVVDGATITLGATSSGSTTTNGMSYTSTLSSGTATVVLTKVSGVATANIQTLVNGITYQNTNTDDPTAGNRVFTLTQIQDSGGTANSGADTTALSIASTVAVTPVNDAPTLTATATGGTFTESAPITLFSGTAVSSIESGQTITSLTFTVGNVLDATEEINVDGTTVTLTNGATGSTTTNSMTYNVTVSSGTATVVLTKVAGVSSANMQTLVDGMSYQNTNPDPTTGTRTVTLTQVVDSGGTSNGGIDTTTLSIASSVAVTPVNDAPTLTATAAGGTFTEGSGLSTGAAVSLFNGSSVSTIEAGQTIASLTFTVGNVLDSTEVINVDGSTVALTNAATGTTTTNGMTYNVTVSSGTATVVLTKIAGVSSANMQALVDGMSYQNTSQNPTTGTRTVTLTQIKDTGGTGNGGTDTTSLSVASSVAVTPVNDAPLLSASALNPTFTEAAGAATQASAVSVFSASAISMVETGQAITDLTFTISGIVDGASERIVLDGTTITLGATNSGTTSGNGMSYTSTVASGTATVVLSKVAGISTAAAQTLINSITYQNTNTDDPTVGNRVFTITQLVDNGGTANGGSDNSAPNIASTIAVVARNDAPTLSTSALDPTFTEAAGAGTQAVPVNVFNTSTISTVEAGQSITGITLTISGLLDGSHEVLSIDGSALDLSVNNAGSTTTTGMNYTISLSGSTATITLSKPAGISTATAQAMIDGITYQNTLTDTPTAGTRTITVTQLQDDGGNANGGSDTATLSIASHVLVTAANDAATGTVTISGTPTQNQTLTASNSIADLDGMGTVTYHWLRNGVDTNLTGSTYVLTQADVGTQISVNAVYVDGGGTTETMTSSATSAVADFNDAPTMSSATLTAFAVPSVSWQISEMLAQAADADNDPLTVFVVQAPQHGTLTLLANGSYQYTADNGYVGADTFTYRAFDGQTTSATVRQMSIQVVSTSISVVNPGTNTTDTPSTPPRPDPAPVEIKQPDRVEVKPADKPKAPEAPSGQPSNDAPTSDTTTGSLHQHILGSAWIRQGAITQVGMFKQAQLNPVAGSNFAPTEVRLSGALSISSLLELIQPNTERTFGINLLSTPLSSITHALPSNHDAGWLTSATNDDAGGLRITRAASYSTGIGVSIGAVWWTARVSGLITSALISTPAWRALDPLPVLTSPTDDDDDDDDHMGDKEVEYLFDADRPIEQDLPIIQ